MLEDGDIHNLASLVANVCNMTTALELERLQVGFDFLHVTAVFMIDVEDNRLDDSHRACLEVFGIVDIFITAPRIVAGVTDLKQSIEQAFADALAHEPGVDE